MGSREKPYRVREGCVVDRHGAIVYDWLDSDQQARDLVYLLNRGVDPSWDQLKPAYERLLASRAGGKP